MRSMVMFMTMAFAAGSAPAIVPFVLDNGGVIVPVTVGALRDLDFLLDTGSTRSVVTATVAQRLALRATARTELIGTTGATMAVVAALPPTCLAMQCADAAMAIVMPTEKLKFGTRAVDGILGADVLSLGDFTIDYQRRRFEWGAGPDEQRREDRLSMSVEDGRAIVTLPQARGLSLRLVADSGADAFVLFDSQVVRSMSASSGLNRFALQTLGRTGRSEPALIPMLRVGGMTWRDETVAIVPRPAAYPQTIDGVMPLHRFASVSFRHSESTVVIRHR